MFTLSELKKTKVAQEAFTVGKVEANLKTVSNMIRSGFSL